VIATLWRSRFGKVHIQKNSLNADHGRFHQRDSLHKMIVTTIKIQVHHPEIWVTKDLFTLKREMLTSIETLKFNFSIELMETGKLRHYCHHIHLWTMALKVFQMERVIAQIVLEINVNHAVSQWNIKKHLIQTHVDMIQGTVETGKKEFILEFTEINKSSTQWENGWVYLLKKIHLTLV
jgi:hypothetical protein